jgi:hypothetical protein
MGGAAVVLVLAGLVFPISLLLLAVIFDAVVVVWALSRAWHDNWSPRIMRAARDVHVPHFPGPSNR